MAKKPAESIISSSLLKIHLVLQGVPPGLLMAGKGIMEAEEQNPTATRGVKRTREEEAELLAHWTQFEGERVLAVPFVNLYGSFCQAAKRFKAVAKTPMADILASAISCPSDKIPLRDEKGNPSSAYEVYVEWVRIPPRTGAMVRMGRPRIRDWVLDFELHLDPASLAAKTLKEVIVMAGRTVGIGPWRPQLKGPYGKYQVVDFQVA